MNRTQISCCLKKIWESGNSGEGEILSRIRAQGILGTDENVLHLLYGSDSYMGICICQNASHYIHKMGILFYGNYIKTVFGFFL